MGTDVLSVPWPGAQAAASVRGVACASLGSVPDGTPPPLLGTSEGRCPSTFPRTWAGGSGLQAVPVVYPRKAVRRTQTMVCLLQQVSVSFY